VHALGARHQAQQVHAVARERFSAVGLAHGTARPLTLLELCCRRRPVSLCSVRAVSAVAVIFPEIKLHVGNRLNLLVIVVLDSLYVFDKPIFPVFVVVIATAPLFRHVNY
jgi:hypothetical protein